MFFCIALHEGFVRSGVIQAAIYVEIATPDFTELQASLGTSFSTRHLHRVQRLFAFAYACVSEVVTLG